MESRWRRRKAKRKNRKDRKDEDAIVADVLEGSTRAFVSKKKLEEVDVDKALKRACDRVPANIAAIGRGYKVSLVYSGDNFCALWLTRAGTLARTVVLSESTIAGRGSDYLADEIEALQADWTETAKRYFDWNAYERDASFDYFTSNAPDGNIYIFSTY